MKTAQIRLAYIPWPRAYDADIIYSYVDLSDTAVEQIHEQFGPAFLIRHDFHHRSDRDQFAYRPDLPIQPLSVLSVMAVMTRGNMISAPRLSRWSTRISAHGLRLSCNRISVATGKA